MVADQVVVACLARGAVGGSGAGKGHGSACADADERDESLHRWISFYVVAREAALSARGTGGFETCSGYPVITAERGAFAETSEIGPAGCAIAAVDRPPPWGRFLL